MTVKSLQKQLIAAVAMVLVAVIALGSSTYAWFASNSTVKAESMSFNATTSKNLVISNESSGTFDNTATAIVTGSYTLRPSSVQTLAGSQSFFKNTDGKVTSVSDGALVNGAVITDATITNVTSGVAYSGNIYDVMKYSFYVKSLNGEEFTNLKIDSLTLTGDGATKDIAKSLRIGVVCGTNGFIYAPIAGYTTDYKGLVAAGTVGTNTVESDTNVVLKASPAASDILATTVSGSTVVQVDVYVWYEGQDASCTSINGVYTDNIQMTAQFSAT